LQFQESAMRLGEDGQTLVRAIPQSYEVLISFAALGTIPDQRRGASQSDVCRRIEDTQWFGGPIVDDVLKLRYGYRTGITRKEYLPAAERKFELGPVLRQ